MQSVQTICNDVEGELTIHHLWQVKLALEYAHACCDHSPIVSCDFTDALHMRVRTVLETAVKESPRLAEDGLNSLLKWHLHQSDANNQLPSRREAALLLLTLILYDIPSPRVLKLNSSSKWIIFPVR